MIHHVCRCTAGIEGVHCSIYVVTLALYNADFDECEGEGTGNNCEQVCNNLPGNFDCSCDAGYDPINSTHCRGKLF